MRLEHNGSEEIKDDSATKKNYDLHKQLIEEKLRAIKAIRIAYSRF